MNKLQVFGWALYDLANTSFSALFVTFFFPLFIKVYLGGNEFHVGLVFGLSMLFAGIFVPFIGAISDTTGKRVPFVIVFTVSCVLVTILVAFANLWVALVLGFLANFLYHAALDVYDALLVDIAKEKTIGRVSGYGVAMGYIGTIFSLGMAFVILSFFGETLAGIQAMFPATGVFFLAFSLMTFFFVKDKSPKVIEFKVALRQAFNSLIDTFRSIKQHKSLWLFMLASFLYTDGMNTAIVFLYLYGREQIGLTVFQFFPVYALMALVAAIGAYGSGRLVDKFGPRKVLVTVLFVWVAIIVMLMLVNNYTMFLVSGCLGGAALGTVWTATRPMLVRLAPRKKIAQLFGFQGLTEKFSGVLGPIIFGFVVVKAGYQIGLSVLLFFFFAGLLLFRYIPKK